MKITFKPLEGPEIPCNLPYASAAYVVPTQAVVCSCSKAALQLQGGGITHHDHDTYYAPVKCLACGVQLGELHAKVSTIFGIEEDDRVLHGRPRVY